MARENILYHNINRPLYLQLKDILTEQIEKGELEPGDAIAGERTLAEIYDVSRVTVRKCIGCMVEEGYLIRSHGKETIVANRKINHHLGRLVGIAEELSETNKNVRIKEISQGYEYPSSSVQEALKLEDSNRVFKFTRVVYAQQKPLILNDSYVPFKIGKLLEGMNFSNAKVFAHLEQYGYNLSYGEQHITAGLCKTEESKYLQYEKGRAVLIIKRTTYLDTGYPVLYERSVYRGDAYQYSIKLYRKLQES